MRINLAINEKTPRLSVLEITDEGGDDLLRIKRLPGRWYDHLRELWIVPITIGLVRALEKSESPLGVALLASIEFQELEMLQEIVYPAPSMTIAKMDEVGTSEAIRRAYEHHHAVAHKGDDDSYLKAHPDPGYAPEVKPNKRRRKTEREIKDHQIKTGRID